VHAKIAKLQAENARLTEERDHWKQARESAMAAGEVLKAENARLREALQEAARAPIYFSPTYSTATILAKMLSIIRQALAATSPKEKP
jgi:hypothetical protein